VHFLDFRPLISEAPPAASPWRTVPALCAHGGLLSTLLASQGGGGNEAEDDASEKKSRYGRPVLSARLQANTPFDTSKKSVQTNLWSADASGKPVFARCAASTRCAALRCAAPRRPGAAPPGRRSDCVQHGRLLFARRYNIPFPSEVDAKEFVVKALECRPKA
jgi:hypothetical protein